MTKERLREFIFDRLGLGEDLPQNFTGRISEAADSLEYVDLILAVEQETGIDVPFEELPPFETFDELIAYFMARC